MHVCGCHAGKVENIQDAYADSRFDSTHDANTGFKTDTILAAPVRDGKNNIVGVVQASLAFLASATILERFLIRNQQKRDDVDVESSSAVDT